ncbi:MAG: hypothetical protein QOD30_1803 [Actinomycetota bacterium]|jgi:hypothetical protein|nr:hypothetical protein [Actinomycetota bacterium]
MILDSSVEIDAAPAAVWAVFADVERWSEWTASVTSLRGLDGSELAVGRRFAIKQPRLPRLVWEVTAIDPGRSWTWRQHSPGSTTLATHDVLATDDGRTLVRQRLDQRGVLGALVGRLMQRTSRRYLELEAQGLKARSETAARRDAAST